MSPGITDPRINRHVLPNGVRVLCQSMDSVRSVAVGFWVEAGGIYETVGEEGAAHLLEHLIFKGTRNRSARDIARAIEGRGGHLGAFTEKEFCCYYAVVLDEYLDIAVDILSDIILNHRFTDSQLEREKAVVLEEFSDIEDSPEELVHELLPSALWPDHPLGTSLLGTRESVSRMTRETIRNYWQELYGPDTITVAAAGHVSPARLLGLVERYFTYPRNGSRAREVPTGPHEMSPVVVERRQVGQVHLLIGARTGGALSDSRFPLLVLNAALGGGMGSRMFQVIREDAGLAYSVYSHLTQMRTAGYLGLYLATQPPTAEQATELLARELVDICRNGISEEELREAKEQIKGALVLSQESTSARMTRLATQELYYRRFMSLDEALKTVDRISSNAVTRIARELFMAQVPAVTLVGPVAGEQHAIKDRIDSLHDRISET